MTTDAEIEARKNVRRTEVPSGANDLMLKDLPRPEHLETKDSQAQIFSGSAGPRETAFNTIDLGDVPSALRPVELTAEEQSSVRDEGSAGTAPAHGTEVVTEPGKDDAHRPVPAPSDAQRTVPPGRPNPMASQPPQPPTMRPPRQSSSLKASLAGSVLSSPTGTTASAASHTTPRSQKTSKSGFWLKTAGFSGLVILAALGVTYLVADRPVSGTINGVVIDARNGRVIAGATVDLDSRQVVITSSAGFFSFPDIKAGAYVIKASAPGYQPQAGTIRTESDQTSQFSFTLTPLLADATPVPSGDTVKTESQQSDEPATASTPTGSVGSVDLRVVNVEEYLVFVDGEIYGKNAKTLKRLPAGDHRVVLQIEGYQDYSAVVTVKARVTSSITVAKSDLVPKVDPIKRSSGHFAEGKDYLERNLWPAAIDAFNLAIQFDPQNADAVRYRGWAYLKSADTARAADDLKHAAELYGATKRYMEAVTCTGYLIDISKDDAALWRQRGGYYLALTDYKKAISDYEKALKIDKKSVEGQMALAEACYAAGDYRRAAKEFDRTRKIAGNPTDAYVRMILSYYHAGDNDEVTKKYRDFAKIAPADALTRLKTDPEWLEVLQIVGPEERHKN